MGRGSVEVQIRRPGCSVTCNIVLFVCLDVHLNPAACNYVGQRRGVIGKVRKVSVGVGRYVAIVCMVGYSEKSLSKMFVQCQLPKG